MTTLLVFRERALRFCKEYETWFRVGSKFVGMLFVFACIRHGIGYFTALNSLPVIVLLSLICSIIPSGFVVFIVAAVAAANMMKLSAVIGILAIIVMLIVYLLFLKFSTKEAVILLAVPVLMQWNLEYMIPVFAGLIFTPYAILPAAAGMFMARFLDYCVASASLTGTEGSIDYEGILTAITTILNSSLSDRTFWLYIIVCAAAITAGFIVSRMSFDYSWYISLLAAAAAAFVTALIADSMLGSPRGIGWILLGIFLGLLAGAFIQFFRCVVDYKGKEYVQFEDEDYYYYVKAVPKYLAKLPQSGEEKEGRAVKKAVEQKKAVHD